MAVPEENKIIARALVSAFGGKPTVGNFLDESEENDVDILWCESPEHLGAIYFGTIGVYKKKFTINGELFPSRIEIIGVGYEAFDKAVNILSTAAFCAIKDDFFCAPGSVLPNAVKMYYPDFEAQHLYFTAPFLWEDKLSSLEVNDDIQVLWVLAIPITDAEFDYLKENGDDALESLLEENDVDIFDLSRESVV